jgi:predicted membrane-bound spermidine synthase
MVRGSKRLALILFFLSGSAGLAYQVLWSKYLLGFIGIGAYSYSIILSVFMIGMALGSKFLGKYSDKYSSPLKLYGILELLIAVYALILFRPLLALFSGAYFSMVGNMVPGETFHLVLKMVFSALLILPPTILMGGTYPAIIKYVTKTVDSIKTTVPVFYSINALGAAIGSILTAFYLQPAMGMKSSLVVVAMISAVVGIIAIWASKNAEDVSSVDESDTAKPLDKVFLRSCLALIFFEGWIGFSYEIGFTRLFEMVLGSTTYSFAIVVASFVGGIGLGALVLSRFQTKIKNPLKVFAIIQLLCGLYVLSVLGKVPDLSVYSANLYYVFSGRITELFPQNSFYLFELAKFAFCLLFLMTPGLLIGMTYPLVVQAFTGDLFSLGEDTGLVYAWDTLGNLCGAFLAGVVLLPWLGLNTLLAVSAAGNVVVGIFAYLIFIKKNPVKKPFEIVMIAGLVLIALYTGRQNENWDSSRFVYPLVIDQSILKGYRQWVSGFEVAFESDDPAATICVTGSSKKGKDKDLTLFVNGAPQASSGNLFSQVMLAHIPLFLKPESQDMLVVGLGSGVTCGAALDFPIKSLDSVDIVQSMPKVAAMYKQWSGDIFADKRFKFYVEDGFSYVSSTKKKYDVIVTQAFEPWTAGVGNLMSLDYYQKAKQVLNPGGIYLQYLHLTNLQNSTVGTLIHTYRKAFSYVYAFQTFEESLCLIGSDKPLTPNWAKSKELFAQEKIKSRMKSVGVMSLESVLFLQRFGSFTSDFFGASVSKFNTLDNMYFEYKVPKDLFYGFSPDLLWDYDGRRTISGHLLLADYLKRFPDGFDWISVVASLSQAVRTKPGLNFVLEKQKEFWFAFQDRGDDTPQKRQFASVMQNKVPKRSDIINRMDALVKQKNTQEAMEVIFGTHDLICWDFFFNQDSRELWWSKLKEWDLALKEFKHGIPKTLEFKVRSLLEPENDYFNDLTHWVKTSKNDTELKIRVYYACESLSDSGCNKMLTTQAKDMSEVPEWLNNLVDFRTK